MRQDDNTLDEAMHLSGRDLKIARELQRLRRQIEHSIRRRDELLADVLSPDLHGEKAFSYRLAAQLSGVSHETLRRQFG